MSTEQDTSGVFGAAARASDYIEEDTMSAEWVREVAAHAVAEAPQPGESAPEKTVAPSRPGSSPEETAARWSAPATTTPPTQHEPVAVSLLFAGNSGRSEAVGPARATKGARGVLAQLGFPVAPGPVEVAERERAARHRDDETTIRQATWTRAVSILVNNPQGGAGKTVCSLVLGGVIASIRGGKTAVVEFPDDPGSLNYRAEGNPRLGLGELVRDVAQITTSAQLHGYTAPQTSFADVIGTTGRRAALTGEAVIKVSTVIDEAYDVRVMDSGNVPSSEAFQAAASVADVLVVPVMNAGDSALAALRLLEELREAGAQQAELASRVIAIRLTDGRPEPAGVKEEVERLLYAAGVRSVYAIPYDPHIAARGQISLSSLAPATKEAFTAAAGEIIRTLQEFVSPAHTINRKG